MPQFNRPGFSMHYRVVDGLLPQDTLFLHGNLSSNLWWEPAINEWHKQDGGRGRAILAEWRGCGGSREFEGPLEIRTLAEDCNALLAYLEIERAHVIGHSTGGLIALHALHLAPELFGRAFLLDPVSPSGLELPPEIAAAFTRMSQERGFCADVLLGTIHRARLSAAFREKIVDAAFGASPAVWLGVPEMLRKMCPLPLANISQPVLIAHGEHDAVLPKKDSVALASALPCGRFLEISDRGHCTNLEDPKRFTEIANAFLFQSQFQNETGTSQGHPHDSKLEPTFASYAW